MRPSDLDRIHFEGFAPGRIESQIKHLVVAGLDETPGLVVLNDVLHIPGFPGLYDSMGRRIALTGAYYVEPGVVVNSTARAKYDARDKRFGPAEAPVGLRADARREARPTLFLGNYFGHFGHWLTDSMSRLWGHLEIEPDALRLFPPFGPARVNARLEYIAAITDFLGLSNVTVADEAVTVYDEVIVPNPAFQMRHKVYWNADEVHLRYARSLNLTSRYAGQKIYLSRSTVNKPLRQISMEGEIETIFMQAGFDIAHPQTMSLPDQIDMFNSADVLFGFSGSAFHLGMFSLPEFRGQLYVMSGNEPLNTRIVLQQALKQSRCTFVSCSEMVDGVVMPDLDQIRALARNI